MMSLTSNNMTFVTKVLKVVLIKSQTLKLLGHSETKMHNPLIPESCEMRA